MLGSSKKHWFWFPLIFPVLVYALFTSSCGSSAQFLTPQYLVKFEKELGDDGYFKSNQSNSSEGFFYYQINNGKYVQANESGKQMPGAKFSPSAGLVKIYDSVATYISSKSDNLVNYAHQNIAKADNLLGVSFEKDENGTLKCKSEAGNFLFASASSFASGNNKSNFGFGLATLRFDLKPWKPGNIESGDRYYDWTKPLFEKEFEIKSGGEELEKFLRKRRFLKLFIIDNISILYKFYTFGQSSPNSYYDEKTSCVSVIKDGDQAEQSKDNFRTTINDPFVNNASSRQKYKPISLEKEGKFVDGFVLHMQPLLYVSNYRLVSVGKPDDKKYNVIPVPSMTIFPSLYFDKVEKEKMEEEKLKGWVDKITFCQIGSGIKDSKELEEKIKKQSFADGSSEDLKDDVAADDIWQVFADVTNVIEEFSEKISKPSNSSKEIETFFKYFFNDPSITDEFPIITPVTYSGVPTSSWPYFGEKF